MLGMRQSWLTRCVAQQQLQKYETGQNRISASRLYEAAKLLKAPIAWFYEGLDDPAAEAFRWCLARRRRDTMTLKREIEGLLRAYANGPEGRQRLLQILKVLVSSPRR